jgi:hypothetical protein
VYLANFDRFLDFNIARMSSQSRRMFKLLPLIFFMLHWAACLWYILGSSVSPSESWFATKPQIINARGIERYLWSLYWAFTTAATVGYGMFYFQILSWVVSSGTLGVSFSWSES